MNDCGFSSIISLCINLYFSHYLSYFTTMDSQLCFLLIYDLYVFKVVRIINFLTGSPSNYSFSGRSDLVFRNLHDIRGCSRININYWSFFHFMLWRVHIRREWECHGHYWFSISKFVAENPKNCSFLLTNYRYYYRCYSIIMYIIYFFIINIE